MKRPTEYSPSMFLFEGMDVVKHNDYVKAIEYIKHVEGILGNLRNAAVEISHLHLCEQEGMSSGQPTAKQWMETVDNLNAAIEESKKAIEE